MFKKMIFAGLSLGVLASTPVSMHATWTLAKPVLVGSLAGVSGGLIYGVASVFGGGSLVKGFICSGIPLAVVTGFKAGVNQTEDAGLQEYQKKGVFITNSIVGTVAALCAATTKCCVLIAATGGIGLAMAYAGPNASPLADMARMIGFESAQFLAGSALAGAAAYCCW